MRKSTLFLSVVLTTFMLAVLFGVASAYQKIVNAPQVKPVAQTEPVQVSDVQTADQLLSLAPSTIVSPEQAAALAAQMLGHNDVYSVESTTYEGASAYLVTFSSGDLVYLSPTGQVLTITKPDPVVVIVNQPNKDHRDRSGNGGGGGGGGEDHEEPQEHEEHDD